MMKQEFDHLVGITTDPACYERIEFVYMNSSRFPDKKAIADFYQEHDMQGIESVYHELCLAPDTKSKEFQQYLEDLVLFAEFYVEEIRMHLLEIAVDAYKDKTIVHLLREHADRREKERKALLEDFRYALKTPGESPSLGNKALTRSDHYRTVLSGLLIDEWWSSFSR